MNLCRFLPCQTVAHALLSTKSQVSAILYWHALSTDFHGPRSVMIRFFNSSTALSPPLFPTVHILMNELFGLISYDNLVSLCGSAVGVPADIRHYDPKAVEVPKGFFPFRDTPFFVSVDKATQLLGFEPKHSIEDDIGMYYSNNFKPASEPDFSVDDMLAEATAAAAEDAATAALIELLGVRTACVCWSSKPPTSQACRVLVGTRVVTECTGWMAHEILFGCHWVPSLVIRSLKQLGGGDTAALPGVRCRCRREHVRCGFV
eukprot:6174761-Pleurochrysis_carterae.AAC.1